MAFKDLSLLKDSVCEEDLQEIAIRGNIDIYRGLPEYTRMHLLGFLKRSGIADHRVLLLDMMLQERQPDILITQRLEAIIDEVRGEVISKTMREEQAKRRTAEKPRPAENAAIIKNPNRMLSAAEILQRFKKLGVDFYKMMKEWESFYATHRFGQRVKKLSRDENYQLPVPSITNKAMEAFEQAHREGHINTFMIDDARVADGTTLKLFERKVLKLFKKKYGFTTLEDAVWFLNRTTPGKTGVRVIGVNTEAAVINPRQKEKCFQEYTPQNAYESLMGLGTYTRLFHYLDENDANAFYGLKCFTFEGDKTLYDRTVLFNNKTARNQILTRGPNPDDQRFMPSLEVGEEITEPLPRYQTPTTMVASDDMRFVKNNGPLAHMDTWPAPANPANLDLYALQQLSEAADADDKDDDIPF